MGGCPQLPSARTQAEPARPVGPCALHLWAPGCQGHQASSASEQGQKGEARLPARPCPLLPEPRNSAFVSKGSPAPQFSKTPPHPHRPTEMATEAPGARVGHTGPHSREGHGEVEALSQATESDEGPGREAPGGHLAVGPLKLARWAHAVEAADEQVDACAPVLAHPVGTAAGARVHLAVLSCRTRWAGRGYPAAPDSGPLAVSLGRGLGAAQTPQHRGPHEDRITVIRHRGTPFPGWSQDSSPETPQGGSSAEVTALPQPCPGPALRGQRNVQG